jgi:hypothetical protein
MLTSEGSVFSNVLKIIFRPFRDLINLNIRLTLIARNIVVIDANCGLSPTYFINTPNIAPITITKSNLFQFSLN